MNDKRKIRSRKRADFRLYYSFFILHSSLFIRFLLPQLKPGVFPIPRVESGIGCSILKYYAQKSVTALIDNSLQRFLKFHTCIGGHMIKLVAKSLVDKLVKRFAENI